MTKTKSALEHYGVVLDLMPEYHKDWQPDETEILFDWFKIYEKEIRAALSEPDGLKSENRKLKNLLALSEFGTAVQMLQGDIKEMKEENTRLRAASAVQEVESVKLAEMFCAWPLPTSVCADY